MIEPNGPVLEVKDLVKYYGDRAVLDGISFRVYKGETKIIIGTSGSGKSTMLKLIMALDKPDEGTILVEGQDITKLSESELVPIRQKIGMVFQESALFDSMSVRENVGYRLYEDQVDEGEIERRVKESLQFVGLAEAIDKFPVELSGGMRRRVSLARALISNPQIMLYDEPTAGLDPVTSRRINELIIALRDLKAVTGIFVTHRLRDAFTLASHYATDENGKTTFHSESPSITIGNTRFVMLRDGKVIFEGPDEVLRRTKDPYIRKFLE